MRKSLLPLAVALVLLSPAGVEAQQSPQDSPDWLSRAKIVAEAQDISIGEAVRRARQRLAGEQAAR